jgi:hypothetical protein
MSDLAGCNHSVKALATLGTWVPLLLAVTATACGDDGSGDRSPPVYAHLDMIDDMEDGNLDIRQANGRMGSWQAFNDGTATGTENSAMTNMDPPRPISSTSGSSVSQHGFHISGGGYSGWGAGWMVDFNAVGVRLPYDVSPYGGLVFWAKSDGPPTEVRVALPDVFSDVAGGICDPNDTRVGGKGCYDDYGTNITLTRQWRRYEIAFASVSSGSWGLKHQFDTQHVYGIKFSVMPSYALFDSWIDDVAFYAP